MILGIDPGRDKSGWVLTDEKGALLASGIFATTQGDSFLKSVFSGSLSAVSPYALEISETCPETFVVREWVMGNGTGKDLFLSLAKKVSLGVKLVSEKGTTLQARELYWGKHLPRGVMRLFPSSMRVPPRDVDDFAAWAIVLKYLEVQRKR